MLSLHAQRATVLLPGVAANSNGQEILRPTRDRRTAAGFEVVVVLEIPSTVHEHIPEIREADVREKTECSAGLEPIGRRIASDVRVGEDRSKDAARIGFREIYIAAQILLVRPACQESHLGVVERAIQPIIVRAEAAVLAVHEEIRRAAEPVLAS